MVLNFRHSKARHAAQYQQAVNQAVATATAKQTVVVLDKNDLRMKLLETYYAAAASNRQGFLDVARKIAEERASLNADEWDKITRMSRQIGADDSVFAPVAAQPDEEDVANCA